MRTASKKSAMEQRDLSWSSQMVEQTRAVQGTREATRRKRIGCGGCGVMVGGVGVRGGG